MTIPCTLATEYASGGPSGSLMNSVLSKPFWFEAEYDGSNKPYGFDILFII